MCFLLKHIKHNGAQHIRTIFLLVCKNLFAIKNAGVVKAFVVSLVLSLYITIPLVHISHAGGPYS